MILILHLPPATEARLRAAAHAQGLNPVELAARLLETSLPTIAAGTPLKDARTHGRSPEFVATVKRIRGQFSQRRGESGTEALHRERQADKVREEHDLQGTGS